MRGKHILMLPLIAMLFGVMMVNIGVSPAATEVWMEPTGHVPGPGELMHPGEIYSVTVGVNDVVDLWAAQITVEFAPFITVLSSQDYAEGDFLSSNNPYPQGTAFFAVPNPVTGSVTSIVMRTGKTSGGRVGASGSGVIATFNLLVMEVGESPLELGETILLDSNGDLIPHGTGAGAFFHGTTGYLIRVNMPDGRKVKVGTPFHISAKVRNDGDLPLLVRVHFLIHRMDDGRNIEIYAGQNYAGGGVGEPLPFEYLYVNEFNEWYYDWTGDPSNLFGDADGSYIESGANADWASLYGFDDITLAGREIDNIWCETYAQYPNGPTEAVDIDLYGFSSVSAFAWWGSGFAGFDWAWRGLRWVGSDSVMTAMPELADETELNNLELLVYNYHGDAPDIMRVDAIRLRVDFASITPVDLNEVTYELLPGEELDLGDITWTAATDHIGSYTLSAAIEYTNQEWKWNSYGSSPKTLSFWIVP